jgi:hypothetical protein
VGERIRGQSGGAHPEGPAEGAPERTREIARESTNGVIHCVLMPKTFTAFRVAPELLEAMREIKTTDGVPMSVQVDFALRAWLQARGVRVRKEPKRRPARKRRQAAR